MPVIEREMEIWLKGEDLGREGEEVACKITRPHRMVTIKRQGQDIEVEEIGITLSGGEERLWIPSKKALTSLVRRFGKDSDAWVKKEITLYTVKMNVFGEDRLCIFIKEETNGKRKAKK